MKLLQIGIVSDCNFDCVYCPVKRWRYPLDYVFPSGDKCHKITNKALLKYADAFLPPDEWLIEISGGEPGLYPEIIPLIPELTEKRNYYVLIKTNGSLYIPKTKNSSRIASWHIGKDFPKHYDQILIMRAMEDDWRAKVKYCKDNNIPYGTIAFDELHRGKNKESPVLRSESKITETLFISSMGQVVPCSAKFSDKNPTIFDMAPPVTFKDFWKRCPKCKNICDNIQFFPEHIRHKIETDYEVFINGK